jgi:hypothetical protein
VNQEQGSIILRSPGFIATRRFVERRVGNERSAAGVRHEARRRRANVIRGDCSLPVLDSHHAHSGLLRRTDPPDLCSRPSAHSRDRAGSHLPRLDRSGVRDAIITTFLSMQASARQDVAHSTPGWGLPGSSGCLCAHMRAWDREGTLHPTRISKRSHLPAVGRGTLHSLGWPDAHASSRDEARGSRVRTHDLRNRCSSPDRAKASGGAGKAAAPGRDG